MNHPEAKSKIRDRMRVLRRGLTPAEVDGESLAVVRQVLDRPEAARAGVVCLYAANPQEVQTAQLLAAFLREGKVVAVPDWQGWLEGSGVRLFSVRGEHDLLRGERLAPQPLCREGAEVAVERVDLFLVPGLAFSARGERLGMGGGFYDRLLMRASPSAAIFGLAFSFQVIDQLPVEPHDVPVHRVIHP